MKKDIVYRVLGLLTTIAGVAFNYVMASGNKMSVITARYESLFVPAGYAFIIWSCIYLSVIIYSVYSLAPGQRWKPFHNGLAKLLIVLGAGGMAWIWAYTSGQLGLSVIFILCMLGTALLAVKSAHLAITEKNQTQWLMVPFGLYAAWLCVATISNISLFIKSRGWLDGILNETIWTIIMLSIASIIAIVAARRYRTITFPLVTAWATIAIWVKHRDWVETVQYGALTVSILLLVFIAMFTYKKTIRVT